ncbi:MAG: phosphoglycerate kinase [Candidatus Marinimicrobia bacterium]|nr:phosphoglycerate kinase [Candidatus Neomarinimicrobiota bacterium]MBL7046244.1 phosphoglycerate kinase [Candidatus Neomarinimicrobiota bacterium]
MKMKTIKDLNLHRQRVLMRVDFNVPLLDGQVTDDFRIQAALPSIEFCMEKGASLILMSHLGRPNGKYVKELSLIPVGEVLSDIIEKSIKFSTDCISQEGINVSKHLIPGEIHLLENLRFHDGETENDPKIANKLAQHGTVYVNDAFGTAHRAHASNVGVAPHYQQKGIGLLMEKEYAFLHDSMVEPKRPLVIVLGGAKIGTKLNLINRFIHYADEIIVGGGMAFTFLKVMGYSIGKSLVEEDLFETAAGILKKAESKGVDIHFPKDFSVTDNIDSGIKLAEKKLGEIEDDEIALDIGSETISSFRFIIENASTLVWNGPMGVFEKSEFRRGTMAIAKEIANVKSRGGCSIIGGGDTAAAVRKFGMETFMSHISTGGGASLKLLAGQELPALEALKE